jgi:FkbM family methyltransferase
MTFISYAQNAEDVILWRALKHIPKGFYIDVGANDPEDDSVTKAFYDHGWQGINIEPLPEHYASLQAQRSRDINLQIAAGDYDGELTLFDMPGTRGWATSDPDIADHYRQQGLEVVATSVLVRKLANVCAELVVADIHFLKIDVEGFEAQVIQGMDFTQWRPWILVVEATRPNSQDSRHQDWEPVLLDNHYRYAYSDGLNRYYVAEEHLDLIPALAQQPNVFDDYQFIGYQRAEQNLKDSHQQIQDLNNQLQLQDLNTRLQLQELNSQLQIQDLNSRLQLQELNSQLQLQTQSLNNELQQSRQQIQNLHSQLQQSQQQVKNLHNQLTFTTNSLSWRITQPLRQLNHGLGKIRQLFRHQPTLSMPDFLLQTQQPTPVPEEPYQRQLSPRAARIHADLQKAIEKRKN